MSQQGRSGPAGVGDCGSLGSAAQLLQAALSLLRGGAFGSQLMSAGEEDRLMWLPEVRRLTGMSCSALHDQIAHGQFPRSIKISAGFLVGQGG
jgi:predicted DNA-binding transcriptional regulator AlpA